MNREALNIIGGLLALMLVSLLGMTLYALFHQELPPSNKDVLLIVIGILSTNVSTIVGFFFGSSSTNKKQADTIAALAAQSNVTSTTTVQHVAEPSGAQ